MALKDRFEDLGQPQTELTRSMAILNIAERDIVRGGSSLDNEWREDIALSISTGLSVLLHKYEDSYIRRYKDYNWRNLGLCYMYGRQENSLYRLDLNLITQYEGALRRDLVVTSNFAKYNSETKKYDIEQRSREVIKNDDCNTSIHDVLCDALIASGYKQVEPKQKQSITEKTTVTRPQVVNLVVERTPKVEVRTTQSSFDKIGGQVEAVKEAKALVDQLKNPDKFKQYGVLPVKAVLLYGKPGNGKTMLARAIATEADAVFKNIEAPELLSSFQAKSAEQTAKLFLDARDISQVTGKRVILFMDEVDAIVSTRQNRLSEAQQLALTTLLVEIDGFKGPDNITLICSTNILEGLDPAFLSRMTKKIEVPNPTELGVIQIFEKVIEEAESIAGRSLKGEDLDIAGLVRNYIGLSGRDIAHSVQNELRNLALSDRSVSGAGLLSNAGLSAEIEKVLFRSKNELER